MDNIAEILGEKNSDSKQKKRDIELSTPADFTPPEELTRSAPIILLRISL